jgi:hypothetical protein
MSNLKRCDSHSVLAIASLSQVRIRPEAQNSMNNRFAPDPQLRTKAVLMLDDDILMPCADLGRSWLPCMVGEECCCHFNSNRSVVP